MGLSLSGFLLFNLGKVLVQHKQAYRRGDLDITVAYPRSSGFKFLFICQYDCNFLCLLKVICGFIDT